MGIPLTPISNSQTFGTWLQRTNDLVSAISGNVVTTDSSTQGSVTTGNAYVNGNFGSILIWAGNSTVNSSLNNNSFFSSWGFTVNTSGLYHPTILYANGLNTANGVVICNSSGLFTNTITTNNLSVSPTLHVNSTSVNVTTLTASGNVIANNAQLGSSLSVGSATLIPTSLSIGQAILSTSNLVMGGISSVLYQNVFIANSTGNLTVSAMGVNTSWGFSANSTGVYGNNVVSSNLIQISTSWTANSISLTVGNTILGSAYLYLGNSSVNTYINSVAINTSWGVSGNSSALYANVFSSNIVTVNTSVTIGNSTVNAVHNSSAILISTTYLNSTNLVIGNSTFASAVNVNLANSSGNISISPTGVNTSWSLSANTTGLYTNAITTNNLFVNTTAVGNSSGFYVSNLNSNNVLTVGNSTVNTVANSTTITVANISATNIYVNSISTNTLNLAGSLSPSAILLGNSTVNCYINSVSMLIGNSTYINIQANTGGIFTNGNITVSGNLYVSGNISSQGTTVGTGDYIPSSNTYNLGNTTNRWIVWAVSANVAGNVSMIGATSTLLIGNSTVNASVNSTVFSGVSNNTNYVGAVTAANVVSNAQLSSNLANYPNTTNLTNNLANYQTTSGLNANIAAYLPTYAGAVYVSNLNVGNSTVNATINSTFFTATSNNTSYVGAVTVANVVSNAQLSANLANYPNTTQLTNNLANYVSATNLTNNLANYLLLSGVAANVYPILPNYTGVLNASSLAVSTSALIGNSTVNLTSNSTSLKWQNSTVTFSMGPPTSAQQSNGQYYYDSSGSWTTIPTQYGNVLTTGTTTQNIDSWAMSSFYAAEYLIDVGDNVANNRTLTKILLTHDSNNAYITEYATIVTNSSMGVFEATSNSTVVTLNWTPVSTNTTVRWCRTII